MPYADLNHEVADIALRLSKGGGGPVLLGGQLQHVAPYAGNSNKRLTSASQVYSANAATTLTIQTPDASGQVVEPAVCYIPGGWNGHAYWALITGYTSGNNAFENPSLYYSDDGQTFTAVTMATVNGVAGTNIFPIAGQPASGYNDDPEIVLGPDGLLHLFWMSDVGTNFSLEWCTYDGTNVSPVTTIIAFSETAEAPIAPVLYWDGINGQWVLYYTDVSNFYNSVNAAYRLQRRTCAGTQPNGTWSAATTCTVSGLPANNTVWESHIEWFGDQLHMVCTVVPFQSNGATIGLYFAISNDGLTFNFNSQPLLVAPPGANWDSGLIYRGDIVRVDATDGTIYGLYYSGRTAASVWKMGYTTIKVGPAPVQANPVPLGIPANTIAVSLAARATPLVPYVFGDSCVRANSATSPGTADSGQAWTVDAGTPGITSNQIYATTTANTKLRVALTGVADGFFTAEFPVIGTTAGLAQYLLVRYQDVSNFYGIGINQTSANYDFQSVIAGVTKHFTLPVAPQGGDVVGLKCFGQTITCYVNGVQVAVFPNNSSLSAVSAVGIQLIGSTATTVRNITARTLINGN